MYYRSGSKRQNIQAHWFLYQHWHQNILFIFTGKVIGLTYREIHQKRKAQQEALESRGPLRALSQDTNNPYVPSNNNTDKGTCMNASVFLCTGRLMWIRLEKPQVWRHGPTTDSRLMVRYTRSKSTSVEYNENTWKFIHTVAYSWSICD